MKQDQCATLMAINGFAFLMDKTPATEELLREAGWVDGVSNGASFGLAHPGHDLIEFYTSSTGRCLCYSDSVICHEPTMGQIHCLLLAAGVDLSCHWHD
jgi:hypothetical protein